MRVDRRTILASGVCAMAGAAMGKTRLKSSQKGFCLVPRTDPEWAEKLRALNARWFYTWGTSISKGVPPEIEFVPMQWGKWGCTQKELQAVTAAGHQTLLGFNEPDRDNQANLTVEKAIELWPMLMETGMRLGSPAGVHADGEWMTAFMAEVQKRGYRVDFITVHSYMGNNPKHFLGKMAQIQKLYNRPIWITEFAVADWQASADRPNKYSPDHVYRFMEKVLPALEKIDYIERYAWFSGKNPPLKPSYLFNEDGSLNKLGRLYASI